jgi:histone deacetylase 6
MQQNVPQSHARSKTGYAYDERMTWHFHPSEAHPEHPDRIKSIHQAMQEHDLLAKCIRIPVVPASKEQILRVHDASYWSLIESNDSCQDEAERAKLSRKFNSIYLNSFSLECALLAAGGTTQLASAIVQGKVSNGFAIVRPPGHHAESHCAMGFCLFNNVAVAIAQLKQDHPGIKILILDWDIHHGNGTQEIFLQDPNVLYISIHRYENGAFYPHSEQASHLQVGVGKGAGKTVNIPWPDAGMGDGDYLYVFSKVVMPIAYEFAPDLVVVSAGFDAAVGDPIGECTVTPDGFASMTYLLKGLAGGKILLALEGGYDIDSLSLGATACMKVLIGEDSQEGEMMPSKLDNCFPSAFAIQTVNLVIQAQASYWRSLGYTFKDPSFNSGKNLEVLSLSSVFSQHWERIVEDEPLSLTRMTLANVLFRQWESFIHASDDVFDEPEVLVICLHGGAHVRSASTVTNVLSLEDSFVTFPVLEYLKAFAQEKFCILDVLLDNALDSEDDLLEEGQPRQEPVVKLISHLWRLVAQISKARNIFLLGADGACKSILSWLEVESNVEESCLKGVILLHPDSNLLPCPRNRALWLWERSFFVYPGDGTFGSVMSYGKLFGNTISSGTAFRADYPVMVGQFKGMVMEFIKKRLVASTSKE